MAGTVDSIRKDIAALQDATVTMADELNAVYKDYLEALGQATRQQLIMASYHLCTQDYPDAFLRMSVKERQGLQEALRELGTEAHNRLKLLLEPTNSGDTATQLATYFADPPGPLSSEEAEPSPQFATDSDSEADREESGADEAEAADSDLQLWPPRDMATMMPIVLVDGDDEGEDYGESEEGDNDNQDDDDDDDDDDAPMMKALLMNSVIEAIEASRAEADDGTLTPTTLARRHMLLERQIRNILQGVSKAANHLLQQAKVVPKLPDSLMTAAAEAHPASKMASVPNLLNMLIDLGDSFDGPDPEDEDEDSDEDDQEERPRAMAHLVVLNLRLSDIEFAEPQASLWRGKLRASLGKLKKLGKQYQRKQREQAIAEAELAWRSVWYDDSPTKG